EELASLVLIIQRCAAGQATAALVGGERGWIEHDRHRVLVPAYHPEPFAIGRNGRWLMPINGGMLARPSEVIVRKALSKRGVVRQIEVGEMQVSAHARLQRLFVA